MRIIKYGDGYPMRVVCSKCKSTLEIELTDLRLNVEHFLFRDEHVKYITCAVCGEGNVVEREIIDFTVGK